MQFYFKSQHGAAAEEIWKGLRLAQICSSEQICIFKLQKEVKITQQSQEINCKNSSQKGIPSSPSLHYLLPTLKRNVLPTEEGLTASLTIKQKLILFIDFHFLILRGKKKQIILSTGKVPGPFMDLSVKPSILNCIQGSPRHHKHQNHFSSTQGWFKRFSP